MRPWGQGDLVAEPHAMQRMSEHAQKLAHKIEKDTLWQVPGCEGNGQRGSTSPAQGAGTQHPLARRQLGCRSFPRLGQKLSPSTVITAGGLNPRQLVSPQNVTRPWTPAPRPSTNACRKPLCQGSQAALGL